MFTGIVEALGAVERSDSRGGDRRLYLAAGGLDLSDLKLGDSVCVSGVCLTAVEIDGRGFSADVSGETLTRTVIGDLAPGDPVNLEKALTPTTRLGGHLVSGHVDGVGAVREFCQDARSWRLVIDAPAGLARYIAEKGSICVDGVSLTVNGVDGARFDLNVIPHTLQQTSIGGYRPGRRVNLEVDLIARYLERLMLGERAAAGGVSERLLRDSGFINET